MQLLIDGVEHPPNADRKTFLAAFLKDVRQQLLASGRWVVSCDVHGFEPKQKLGDVLLIEIHTASIKDSAEPIRKNLAELVTHGPLLNQAASLAVLEYADECREAIEDSLSWWASVIEAAECLEVLGESKWTPIVESSVRVLAKIEEAKTPEELSEAFGLLTVEAEKWL